MADQQLYRLSWDMPSGDRVEELQAAGVTHDQVPATDWHRIGRTATAADGILDQAAQLQEWAVNRTEYIRDVVLERQITEPTWEEVPIQ